MWNVCHQFCTQMLSWKLGYHNSEHCTFSITISLIFMVVLSLQLACLQASWGVSSVLISPAGGGAHNVSYGTDNKNPILTAKHITTQVSAFLILVTHSRWLTWGERSMSLKRPEFATSSALLSCKLHVHSEINRDVKDDMQRFFGC